MQTMMNAVSKHSKRNIRTCFRSRKRSERRSHGLMGTFSALLLVLSVFPALTSDALAQTQIGQSQASAQMAAQDVSSGTASIAINVVGCAAAPASDDAQTVAERSFVDLSAACTSPVPNVTLHLTNTGTSVDSPQTTGSTGAISYTTIAAGTYTAYTDIPRGTAYEVVYCAVDGGAPYQKTFDDAIVTTFADLQTEQITCSWFVVPVAAAGQAETPTPEATGALTATAPSTPPTSIATATETATAAATVSPIAPASVTELANLQVNVLACPVGSGFDSGSRYSDLSVTCTTPGQNVAVHLSDLDLANDDPRTTGGDGSATWEKLAPGSYTIYTDTDRTIASEVLYCSADGGDPYQKQFNDAIVATFQNVTTEQLVCSWFQIPVVNVPSPVQTTVPTTTATATATATTPAATSTPQETITPAADGSLTVHLAACPVGYVGTDFYADCHGQGIADMEFLLSGPDGEQQQTTIIPETPGPGVVSFSGLAGGDYTLAGGPPGDFGTVDLYCTRQPGGERIESPVDGTQVTVSLLDADTVLCDWYYIPDNLAGNTPTPEPSLTPTAAPTSVPTATPTQVPNAEILVTLRSCPARADGYGGAVYEQLKQSCTQSVDDVPFSLGDVAAPPLSANTGVSGDGAVRFYDLLQASYTLAPTLPSSLTSIAVFCHVDGSDPYQKALQNGAVTFVDVKTESIACDWYAVKAPVPTATVAPGVTATAAVTPSGPTGSITVREYLCAKDKASIKDWERDCKVGSSSQTFTLKSSDGKVEEHGSTDKAGVLVFRTLADGHYALNQDKGSWCRATADRVDSQSRVIVGKGGNTDVVLYQCNQVTSLPDTGSGTPVTRNDGSGSFSLMLLTSIALAMLASGISVVTFVRSRRDRRQESEHRETVAGPVVTDSGRTRMRFK
jgi:hypothetical protein